MASEGSTFLQFYVPQAICSASRAALLSGSYPHRTNVFGAHGPNGRGPPTEFATIAEPLKKSGYNTVHFGKWHCGDTNATRPLARGFDEHAGLMYSNDMWHLHPMQPKHWGKFPLRFWNNGEIEIEDIQPKDQKNLTKWATEKSVDFIKRNKDQPFFLYTTHSMPHVPLYVSKEFEGISGQGLYGDVLAELDWSVGQINQALKDNGIEDKTMIIFSSDNGPWAGYGDHAGKPPYREAKATSFDGGTRSPLIVKYPKMIPPNSASKKVFCSIDLMPTILDLAGGPHPDNKIDGKNVLDLMTDKKGAKNPHHYYYFSTGRHLEAIMSANGRWKLHLPHSYRHVQVAGADGFDAKYSRPQQPLALYDMKNDPMESKNIISNYPELADELKQAAQAYIKKPQSKQK
ncbi:arylsulfatase A (precursor) [Lentisphaera araneosa HTCC2155]|uniref:Arylsulfatase A (Precursor) n=1 Tax=Lentisphaera araneosa HTCC2155 TaxID=313628 RepID=A6DSM5_9BACT|nr:sulfatase-like hydrolase/transferase [Lentisphaera araneosa]EDM25378.1 arylsulfatase A (precursor) [Lentisphaera araneosa HTCC2155]